MTDATSNELFGFGLGFWSSLQVATNSFRTFYQLQIDYLGKAEKVVHTNAEHVTVKLFATVTLTHPQKHFSSSLSLIFFIAVSCRLLMKSNLLIFEHNEFKKFPELQLLTELAVTFTIISQDGTKPNLRYKIGFNFHKKRA